MKTKNNFFEQVYKVVRKIPKGKVTTYGEIARYLGTTDARKVGWALHANPDKKTPCHRVVNKDGRLAPGYAFGGAGEQKKKLLVEGVIFLDKMHVDLKKCIIDLG
jgi:methylated-DNA-protein-cysteine methyltransferase-like protein